jgi:Dolichyl-phosphate-mannose-protein mannosyltransferase
MPAKDGSLHGHPAVWARGRPGAAVRGWAGGVRARAAAVVLVVAGTAWLAVLGLLYTHLPPSPDQSVYDYIGWILRQGGAPYVDAADQNWPGAMLVHAAGGALFGDPEWAARRFDYLLLLAACGLLAAYLHRHFGAAEAVAVVFVYPAMYVSASRWFSGQRDVVAAPLLIAAVAALLERRGGGGRWWCAGAGACLALAALIRPTFLLLAPLALLLDDLGRGPRPRRRLLADHGLAAAACAGVLGACALAALPGGVLAAWWDVTVRFNSEVYVPSGYSLRAVVATLLRLSVRSWQWYLLTAAAGVVLALRRGARAATWGLLAVALAGLGSAAVQGKGYIYHLGPVLPVMAAFVALTAAALVRVAARPEARSAARVGALVLVCCMPLGLGRKVRGTLHPEISWALGRLSPGDMLGRYGAGEEEVGFTELDALRAAAYLQRAVPPDGTVLAWGRPMRVNVLARRRLPYRFASFALLDLARPPCSLAGSWTREVREALAVRPPRFILLFRAPDGHGYLHFPADGRAGPAEAVWQAVKERYRLDRSFGSADCYRLAP